MTGWGRANPGGALDPRSACVELGLGESYQIAECLKDFGINIIIVDQYAEPVLKFGKDRRYRH